MLTQKVQWLVRSLLNFSGRCLLSEVVPECFFSEAILPCNRSPFKLHSNKTPSTKKKDLEECLQWKLPNGFSVTTLENWIINPELQKELRNTQAALIHSRDFIFQTSQVTENNSVLSCSELPNYNSDKQNTDKWTQFFELENNITCKNWWHFTMITVNK